MNEHLIRYTARELEDLCEKYGLRYSYKYDRLYIQAIGLFRPTAWINEFGTGFWNSFVHFDRIFDGQEKFYITQHDKPEVSTDHIDKSWKCLDFPIFGGFASKEDFYEYIEDFVKKIGELRIAHLEQQRLKFLQEDF